MTSLNIKKQIIPRPSRHRTHASRGKQPTLLPCSTFSSACCACDKSKRLAASSLMSKQQSKSYVCLKLAAFLLPNHSNQECTRNLWWLLFELYFFLLENFPCDQILKLNVIKTKHNSILYPLSLFKEQKSMMIF